MNERIQELKRQAQIWCDQNIPGEFNEITGGYGHYWEEKFAELIVRECVQVCADRGKHHDGLYSAWADDCSKRIAKHFGVEE